jgi:hypothetical protein
MLELTFKNLLGHLNQQVVINGLVSGGGTEVVLGHWVQRWLQLICNCGGDAMTCKFDLIESLNCFLLRRGSFEFRDFCYFLN